MRGFKSPYPPPQRSEVSMRTRTKKPARGSASDPEEISRAIYEVVKAIPRGTVATYGQVAELAGLPRGHRRVARAMKLCPDGLPWQRVVGRKDARRAQINIQDAQHAAKQRALLKAEKVSFDENGLIALRQFGWLPL